jgi:hypothetical protein
MNQSLALSELTHTCSTRTNRLAGANAPAHRAQTSGPSNIEAPGDPADFSGADALCAQPSGGSGSAPLPQRHQLSQANRVTLQRAAVPHDAQSTAPLSDDDEPDEPDGCPGMPEPRRSHDVDVGHQTLITHERTAGQFVLPGDLAPPAAWPLLDKPEWRAAGEIPGVPPTSTQGNVIAPAITAARLHAYEQAQGPALGAQPFSDYNSVPRAAAVPMPPTPDLPASERPSPGRPHTVYRPINRIAYGEGGDWVRAYIDRNRTGSDVRGHKDSSRRQVVWTDLELYAQVIAWCEQARADKRAFLERGDSHRPHTRTFIIPARCHKADGRVVFDLRPVLGAQAAGKPLRWTLPPSERYPAGLETGVPIPAIADDTHITPRLDPIAFRKRCTAAGVMDEYGIQQVISLGLVSASDCARDSVFQMNYPAVSRHAAFAQALAESEAAEGFLSSPYLSPPLSPARLNPFNAIERAGMRKQAAAVTLLIQRNGGRYEVLVPWDSWKYWTGPRVPVSRKVSCPSRRYAISPPRRTTAGGAAAERRHGGTKQRWQD